MIYFHFYEAFCLFDCQAISSVQSLSLDQLFVTPWTAAHQASPSITNFQSLLKLMSTESVMPSNHLILSHPLLLMPSIFPSISVFSNKPALCIRWLTCWSISPSNAYSGLIFFRINWFDYPCCPRDSQQSSQHHSLKASILQPSGLFIKTFLLLISFMSA